MNIDAHQHFWIYRPEEYGWIGPGMETLGRDYLPEELLPQLQAAGFDGSVAVQARQTVEETAWLLQLADRYAYIRGVVGWVDLCSPQVSAQLERFAAHPRLVGVRHVLQDEPDDAFMLRADFQRGLGLLAGYDLAYDLLLFPRHLAPAYTLAARFPGQRFVLDHIAKPPIGEGSLEPWAGAIRRLAGLPNVWCKISGMVTEAGAATWRTAPYRQYLDVVFAAFGVQRLMLGSDWPVCTLEGPYAEVMQIAFSYIAQLSPAEQAAVRGQTAAACYRLTDPARAPAPS